jgi:hypothetical protein
MFAALASREDTSLVNKALPLLMNAGAKNTSFGPPRTIAQALLADQQKIDRPALTKLLTTGVAGDDLTVLLALACRRAGGDTWSAFRAASPELLGSQPLEGDTVVLINRLSQDRLQLVAKVSP